MKVSILGSFSCLYDGERGRRKEEEELKNEAHLPEGSKPGSSSSLVRYATAQSFPSIRNALAYLSCQNLKSPN